MAYKRVCDTCDSTMSTTVPAIKVQIPKELPEELTSKGIDYNEAAQMDAVKRAMGVPETQMFTVTVKEFCKPACAIVFLWTAVGLETGVEELGGD